MDLDLAIVVELRRTALRLVFSTRLRQLLSGNFQCLLPHASLPNAMVILVIYFTIRVLSNQVASQLEAHIHSIRFNHITLGAADRRSAIDVDTPIP